MSLLRWIAGMLLLCVAQPALANALGSDGFTHSGWTSKDGIPGMLQALAQTPDGYLWLGTYEGLYRFDGVSFEHVPVARGHPAGAIPVSAVFVSRNGDLWVGYAGAAGAEVYRGGRLIRAGMPNPPGEVTEFREDLDGGIWAVGGRTRRALKRFWHGSWQNIDSRWGVPDDEPISSVFPARDGTLWLAAKTRLLFLRRGATRFEDSGRTIRDGASMAQDARGNLWISDPSGTWVVPDYPHGQRIARNPVFYPADATVRRTMILFDREGNLWGSTYTGGVFRIAAPGDPRSPVIRYANSDGLTSNQAVAMLRDREGNIWVATEVGLDQFRRANVVQVPLPPKTSAFGYLIATDQRGDVYIASEATLYRAPPGGEPVPVFTGLDEPRALCRGRGNVLWLAERGQMLRLVQGRVTRRLPLPDAGSTMGCGEDRAGALWLARFDRGVLKREGDHWRKITLPAGAGRAQDVAIDASGNPVLVLDRRAILRIQGSQGLFWPNATVGVAGITVTRGLHDGLYIGGGTGLSRWSEERFERLSIADHPWLRGIRGIVRTPRGETWMINNKGILRVPTSDLDLAFANPHHPLAHDMFGEQDGLTSRTQGSDGTQMTMGGDGRLWFLTRQGVVRVDPARLVRNAMPPPVRIRALTADGVRYADPTHLRLRAGTRSLSIDYTALSLSVPSRVRFRYQLEGVDPDWMDPGTRRQAFYTNLAPGTYRFRVMAANDAGVWNREGATLAFTVPPTFLQSRLFALLCVIAAGLLLWLFYGLRLRTVARRMRARMAERMAERERIARELHDTLLQGVQALVLRFQLVADDIAPDQPARQALEEALDRADTVLAEGRDRVRNLRASSRGRGDLQDILLDVVRRQAFAPSTAIELASTGTVRPLSPLVCDEITRIANEALFNIWRHAQANRIEIEIAYRASSFVVRFRDDGVGIAPAILAAGRREGHFGLTGMRERAAKLDAELTIRSSPAAGTEVALVVPGAIAYAPTRRRRAQRAVMGDELA